MNENNTYQPIICDISNEQYHSLSGISASGVSLLKKSPLDYWQRYLSGDPSYNKKTPPMVFGSLVHTLTLESSKFIDEFVIKQKVDGRTSEGRSYNEKLVEWAKDKNIITEDDYLYATDMSNAVLNHKKSSDLISGAQIEKSIFWTDDDSGMICKCRPDIWRKDIAVLADLKTTSDASKDAFLFSVRKYNYHIQAAMQIDGIFHATGEKINDFVFIVVPKQKPHMPYLYRLDDAAIQAGRHEYKDALKVFKKCFENNIWDLDRNHIHTVDFTQYQLNQNPFQNLMEIYA